MTKPLKISAESIVLAAFLLECGLFAICERWPTVGQWPVWLGLPTVTVGFLALLEARHREALRRSAHVARGDRMLAAAKASAWSAAEEAGK
jgi:hypothetical protein